MSNSISTADGIIVAGGFVGLRTAMQLAERRSQILVIGRDHFDVASIEVDHYFDVSGYQDRSEIEASCQELARGYYGRIEPPAAVEE